MENPIKMDDLGVLLFSETSISWVLHLFFFGAHAQTHTHTLNESAVVGIHKENSSGEGIQNEYT